MIFCNCVKNWTIVGARQIYQTLSVLWVTENMFCQIQLTSAQAISYPIQYYFVVFIWGQELGGEDNYSAQVNDVEFMSRNFRSNLMLFSFSETSCTIIHSNYLCKSLKFYSSLDFRICFYVSSSMEEYIRE